MMRQTLALLSAISLAACARTDAKVGADRVTLIPGPGTLGAQHSKDGRLAYGAFVAGKTAIFVANGDGTNSKRVSFGSYDFAPRWSPDGKSIAFERDNGAETNVVIVPADSGAELLVAGTAAQETFSDWFPDGSGLVFMRASARGNEAWAFRIADHSSERLFSVDGSVNAFPSPDGRWIGYTLAKDGRSTVWLWDREKKTHRQLTTEGFETLAYGCFSPDGRSLLYMSRRSGTNDLWRVDAGSGERRQLTQDVADDFAGRWSPDGSRIAFQSRRGGQPDIWVLATGEGDVQRVTDDAINEEMTLSGWTPDGRSVLLEVPLGQRHLYSLPTTGGAPLALTSGDWAVDDGAKPVSPDGSQVAYAGSKNGDLDIWVVPTAGGESHLVSGAPGTDSDPTWAPDGKRVAFTSVRSGNRDIWIASADGSGTATRLTDWPSSEGNAQWSPDGKTIAFVSERESAGLDLWTVAVTGGTPRRLTTLGTVGTFGGEVGDFRWSRDGHAIAFTALTASAGGQAVFTVNASGGPLRVVGPATAATPAWSPDGRELAMVKCAGGYCVAEIRTLDGRLVRSLGPRPEAYEYGPIWSSDGLSIAVYFEDLLGDGRGHVELRPAGGGPAQALKEPPGFVAGAPMGFSSGGKAIITTAAPYGSALQRIAVPAPIKVP